MPESNGTRRRGRAWTLSDACEIGQLVTIRCQFCRITRHYLPQDLRTLLGDVWIDQVEHRVRCESCGHKQYGGGLPYPHGRGARDDAHREDGWGHYVRKVIWQDGE